MLAAVMSAMIRFYQVWLGVLKPPCCRFEPTCSEYARRAILAHGAARGAWLGLRRIGRCHPWGAYGFDPVPGETRANAPRKAAGSAEAPRS